VQFSAIHHTLNKPKFRRICWCITRGALFARLNKAGDFESRFLSNCHYSIKNCSQVHDKILLTEALIMSQCLHSTDTNLPRTATEVAMSSFSTAYSTDTNPVTGTTMSDNRRESSLFREAQQELDRFKWCASERAGRDLGTAAI